MSEKNKEPQENENTNEEEKESNSVKGFLQVSMRDGRNRTPENLLCMKLYQAQRADKQKRIMLIAEAAWNAQELYGDKVKVDSEKVDALFQVASAFAEAREMKYSPDGFHVYLRCAIPWPFHIDIDNYKVFFKPWLTTIPDYWDKFTGSHRDFYSVESKFSCPYCEAELLNLKYIGRSADSIKRFKKSYEKTEIAYKKVKLDDTYLTMYSRETASLITYSLHCPKCGKLLILSQYETKGEKDEDYEARAKEQWKDVKYVRIETRSELKDEEISCCLNVITNWLTVTGFHSLKNQFLAWANIAASKLEMRISRNINQNTWNEFFKTQRDNEKEGDNSEY
jgi:sarcosine oxidase delta subunit